MKPRRMAILALGSALLGGGALLPACGFPSPILQDQSDGASTSEGGPKDAPVDVFYDGDANITVEAGPDSEGGVMDCDRDRDRVFASGVPCGGTDCNDDEVAVTPASGFRTLAPLPGPPPGNGGDWDCSGIVEKQFSTTNLSCGGLSSLLACDGTSGFSGDPGCGESGPFITCRWQTLPVPGCAQVQSVTQIQGCK